MELKDIKDEVSLDSKPQQESKKGYKERPLIALKTCVVELDDCTVELVEGCEVHGLSRQERNHLLFHGFVQ